MYADGATNSGRSRLVAILGPTNTGKTYTAMERMMGHRSGMIGFPLRLLARENYDRAVAVKGRDAVALITGEEKIVPPGARYFLCTVEAMPIDRPVDFLGIDEIQLCADADRGHVFTDRVLRARGREETMLMGAETIRGLLRQLFPDIEFVQRPRFSTLAYSGAAKITRLPRRSAVVAFSISDVYAAAEIVRRQRGGAAIVLGALSPRTRNAQVAMYQAGEVEYLVATDAIGMGLNMDVDHVAFAATRKFDGRVTRRLSAPELAQIAGRAGRHTRDGTFGTSGQLGPLDPETVERIETNSFDALRFLFWRNPELDFRSLTSLRGSLGRRPPRRELRPAREADDELALIALSRDPDIVRLADNEDAVRTLWDVCQIPDFGKVMTDAHTGLLRQIYLFLIGAHSPGSNRMPTDWVARHVERVNRTDGDLATLMQRIANIRTWTYIAHRGCWMDDAVGWQEKTRAIEDRLSDALHDKLVQRFVDKHATALLGRLQQDETLLVSVTGKHQVLVEGHCVGALEGFRFVASAVDSFAESAIASRAVKVAIARALKREIPRRVAAFEASDDQALDLNRQGEITWAGAPVARLTAGPHVLTPLVQPLASEVVEAKQRERIRRRAAAWWRSHLEHTLAAIIREPPQELSKPARGLLFQIGEALGSTRRDAVSSQVALLTPTDRATLRKLGLRLGRHFIFFKPLLRPREMELRGLLWAVHHGVTPGTSRRFRDPSLLADGTEHAGWYDAVGYRCYGPRAVRVDVVERVTRRMDADLKKGPARVDAGIASQLGCSKGEAEEVLMSLGYRVSMDEEGVPRIHAPPRKGNRAGRPARVRRDVKRNIESPFAKLKPLLTQR